nr:hypothetical protein [candidate division Zixibacteria bacterium]
MGHISTFFKPVTLILATGGLVMAMSGCTHDRQSETDSADNGDWNRAEANLEYRYLQSERRLAETDQLYMVLDMRHKKLLLKLQGAVVWDYPMVFLEEDSSAVQAFIDRFLGDNSRMMRAIYDRHLYEAAEQTPDSILELVSEAVGVKPELLQRDLPKRFQIDWRNNITLEVHTDIEGAPVSRIRNALAEMRRILQMPFGEAVIIIKIEPEKAITLYRAAAPGLPALIYP